MWLIRLSRKQEETSHPLRQFSVPQMISNTHAILYLITQVKSVGVFLNLHTPHSPLTRRTFSNTSEKHIQYFFSTNSETSHYPPTA